MTEATGFLPQYEQALDRRGLTALRQTSQGLFVEHSQLPVLFESYRRWLQRESNSGRLFEIPVVEEKLLGAMRNKEFYLPDGKLVLVGKLLTSETLGKGEKIARYEGTLIDAATLLHPKDPLFTEGSLRYRNDAQGQKIVATTQGRQCVFSTALLKDFFELVRKVPRVRRRFPHALISLRGTVQTLTVLLQRAESARSRNVLFVPGRLRHIKLSRLISSNGIYFVLSEDGGELLDCFSPLGGAIAKLLRDDVEDLRRSAKRGIVGAIELSKKIPQIVGFIQAQQDRFTVSYRVLDDFFKLRGFKSEQDPVDKHVYTCFDLLLRLSREFQSSGWILPQDIAPSLRMRAKDPISYRASKNYLFYVNKQRQILSVRRRGKRPESNLKLILKPLDERLRELKALSPIDSTRESAEASDEPRLNRPGSEER